MTRAGPADTPATARIAASLALLRDTGDGPAVLMGQRGAGAAFMPAKVVFPGGALDPDDLKTARPVSEPDLSLGAERDADRAVGAELDPVGATAPPSVFGRALRQAALRETEEETGLALATSTPEADASALLGFFFRAITPPALPKRFDARFFVASAAHLDSDPDDFSRASGELSHLQWIPLQAAAKHPLPFVTHLAVAELQAIVAAAGGVDACAATAARRPTPFFRHAQGPEGGPVRSRIDPL